MKVLITGAMGYIGGRLVQHLNHDEDINLALGSRKKILAPSWAPNATTIQMNWDLLESFDEACIGVDVVIHLAGMNAQDCAANPIAALRSNGEATGMLLASAIKQRVKRFIFLSTAHVYANPLLGTITEKTPTLSSHPYAISNRAGEELVLGAHQKNEIEGVVVRLSNSFGAPAHKEANCWMLLVNDLCYQAVTTRCMVLSSSGSALRDFVPLTDVCNALTHLLKLSKQDLGDGLFNFGSGYSQTVMQMATLVQSRCEKIMGYKPSLSGINGGEIASYDSLVYRSDAIYSSGFNERTEKSEEIDKLLKFCKEAFQ